jgi:hypothetical protein
MGVIAYSSSNTSTRVDLLTVVELTCRLNMWTSTETARWPNLRATRVAGALGYSREICTAPRRSPQPWTPPATRQASAPPQPSLHRRRVG